MAQPSSSDRGAPEERQDGVDLRGAEGREAGPHPGASRRSSSSRSSRKSFRLDYRMEVINVV